MAKKSPVKVGRVQSHLDDVLLPMGLNLKRVDVEGEGIQIESHPFSITLRKSAQFSARLDSGDLAAFLNLKAPGGVKNFKVSAKEGQLFIDATKTILVEVPVKAVCRLRIHDHTQVFVDLVSLDVMGSGAKNLLQAQLEKINPVLDAEDFPVDASFDEIVIEDGVVVVNGKMAPRG